MVSERLAGCNILIVEDEYYLADDARTVLLDKGADVLGPVATVEDAKRRIDAEPTIDAVLLDINLRGELAFDVADALKRRGIPFLFVTGYDRAAIPDRFGDAPTLRKPIDPRDLVRLIGDLTIGGGRRARD